MHIFVFWAFFPRIKWFSTCLSKHLSSYIYVVLQDLECCFNELKNLDFASRVTLPIRVCHHFVLFFFFSKFLIFFKAFINRHQHFILSVSSHCSFQGQRVVIWEKREWEIDLPLNGDHFCSSNRCSLGRCGRPFAFSKWKLPLSTPVHIVATHCVVSSSLSKFGIFNLTKAFKWRKK